MKTSAEDRLLSDQEVADENASQNWLAKMWAKTANFITSNAEAPEKPADEHLHDVFGTAVGGTTGVVDSSSFGIICVCKQMFMHFLLGIGHLLLWPLSILVGAIQSSLAWRAVYKDRAKDKSIILHAVVETVYAAIITSAVIIALFFTGVFALTAPIMFTVAVGLKTLYHFGVAAYNYTNAALEPNEKKKSEYMEKANHNLIVGGLCALFTAAIFVIMVLGNLKIAAFIGIPVATVAVAYTAFKIGQFFYRRHKALSANKVSAPVVPGAIVNDEKPALTSRKIPPVCNTPHKIISIKATQVPETSESVAVDSLQATSAAGTASDLSGTANQANVASSADLISEVAHLPEPTSAAAAAAAPEALLVESGAPEFANTPISSTYEYLSKLTPAQDKPGEPEFTVAVDPEVIIVERRVEATPPRKNGAKDMQRQIEERAIAKQAAETQSQKANASNIGFFSGCLGASEQRPWAQTAPGYVF